MTLGIGVVLYDLWAIANDKESMSQSYLRALNSPRRWYTLGFWTYLNLHLTGTIPYRFDPLRRIEQYGQPTDIIQPQAQTCNGQSYN